MIRRRRLTATLAISHPADSARAQHSDDPSGHPVFGVFDVSTIMFR